MKGYSLHSLSSYYMPGTAKCYTVMISLIHTKPYKLGTITIPILQIRKRSHRGMICLKLEHYQNQDVNPGNLILNFMS